jgi:hypothetical protein
MSEYVPTTSSRNLEFEFYISVSSQEVSNERDYLGGTSTVGVDDSMTIVGMPKDLDQQLAVTSIFNDETRQAYDKYRSHVNGITNSRAEFVLVDGQKVLEDKIEIDSRNFREGIRAALLGSRVTGFILGSASVVAFEAMTKEHSTSKRAVENLALVTFATLSTFFAPTMLFGNKSRTESSRELEVDLQQKGIYKFIKNNIANKKDTAEAESSTALPTQTS